MEAEIHELAAGYALNALELSEREEFEEHLAGCERCRREIASFQEVAAALAVGAAGPEPRRHLRERIMAAASAEPQNVLPLVRRRSGVVPVMAAAAAVAAGIAIALGAWVASLESRLDETRSALEAERRATAVLANPSARTVSLVTGRGSLLVDGAGRAVLVLDGLLPAGSGKTYEAWVVDADTPRPAGLFDAEGARTVVPIKIPLRKGSVVAVTVERAGGVDRPTTRPLVASSPV